MGNNGQIDEWVDGESEEGRRDRGRKGEGRRV